MEQTTTPLQKLEALAKEKKIRKNSRAYKSALEAINNPGTPIVCGSHTGSGRFAKSETWQRSTAVILSQVGVTYITFNEAPKGGKAGDRVQVTDLTL